MHGAKFFFSGFCLFAGAAMVLLLIAWLITHGFSSAEKQQQGLFTRASLEAWEYIPPRIYAGGGLFGKPNVLHPHTLAAIKEGIPDIPPQAINGEMFIQTVDGYEVGCIVYSVSSGKFSVRHGFYWLKVPSPFAPMVTKRQHLGHSIAKGLGYKEITIGSPPESANLMEASSLARS